MSCTSEGELDSSGPNYTLFMCRFRLWMSDPKLHSDYSCPPMGSGNCIRAHTLIKFLVLKLRWPQLFVFHK